MKKRYWVGVFGGVLLMAAGVWWWQGRLVSAWSLVPEESSVVLEVEGGMEEMERKVLSWEVIAEEVKPLLDWLKERGDSVEWKKGLLLPQPIDKERVGWMMILEAGQPIGERKDLSVRSRTNYRGYEVRQRKEGIYDATVKNVLLVAPTAFMIEDGWRRYQSGEGGAPEKRSREDQVNGIVKFSTVARQFSAQLSSTGREAKEGFSELGELEFSIDETGGFSGSLSSVRSSFFEGPALTNPEETSMRVAAYLPPGTLSLMVANEPEGGILEITGSEAFTEAGSPFGMQEFAMGVLDLTGIPFTDRQFLLLRKAEEEVFDSFMNRWSETAGLLLNETFNTYSIRQVISQTSLRRDFLPFDSDFVNPVVVDLGEYIAFCRRTEVAEQLITSHILGNRLSEQTVFQEWDFLDPSAQVVYWGKTTAWGQGWQRFFAAPIGIPETFLRSSGYLCFSIDTKGQIKGRIVSGSKTIAEKPSLLFTTSLDQPVEKGPYPVSAGGRASWWLVQDAENQIYGLGGNSEVLWKRRLEGRILDDPAPVQLPGGSWGMLFNTSDQLHLIDQQGKEVGSYPIRLPEEATTGVGVAQYQERDGFNSFIGCEQGAVYGFDRDGNLLADWNPRRLKAPLLYPVRHFQYDFKDYLLGVSKDSLLVFQRYSGRRFPAVALDGAPFGSPDFQIHPLSSRMVVASETGRVKVVNTEGQHFNLFLKVGANQAVRFAFADVTGDDRKDYIALEGQQLSVYTYEGNAFNQVFSTRFAQPQEEVFTSASASGAKATIITRDVDKRQFSILDEAGTVLPGFPLAGSGKVSIVPAADPGWNLVYTALGAEVYVYRYATRSASQSD